MIFIHNEIVLLCQRFKNPSTLPEDIIHTLRQEWAAYLLERWSWYHRN